MQPRVGNIHHILRGTSESFVKPPFTQRMIKLITNPTETIKNKKSGSETSFRAALLKTYTLLKAKVARMV
jgi:hypothetical protein